MKEICYCPETNYVKRNDVTGNSFELLLGEKNDQLPHTSLY